MGTKRGEDACPESADRKPKAKPKQVEGSNDEGHASTVEGMISVAGAACAVSALFLDGSGIAAEGFAHALPWEGFLGIFLAVIVLASFTLMKAGFLADALVSSRGRVFVFAACACCFAAGVVARAVGVEAVLAVSYGLSALACVALIVFWATYFSLFGTQLQRIVACLSIAFASLTALLSWAPEWSYIVSSCAGVVSLICAAAVSKRFRGEEVKSAFVAGSKIKISNSGFIIDFQTGIGLGAVVGAMASVLGSGMVDAILMFWSCAVVIVSAIANLVFMLLFKEKYFACMKHTSAFLFSAGLLFLALLEGQAQFFCGLYLVFIGTSFFCVHVSATIEFLRYYDDHPLRIACGGVFAAGGGMLASVVLFTLAEALFPGVGMPYACAIAICALMALHLAVIFFCVYPYDSTLGTEPQVASSSDAGGKGRQRRQMQVDAISERCGLTEREREILELMSRGRNAKYISDSLVISPSTTKTHIYHLYSKLGVHSQQELIDLVESAIGQ